MMHQAQDSCPEAWAGLWVRRVQPCWGLSCPHRPARLAPLTMVDNAILQQRLAQVDPFLRLADFANFQEPGHKLTARDKKLS